MTIQRQTIMRRRWLRRAATGLAVLAVTVPAAPALAGIPPEPQQPVPVRPDDRAAHGIPSGPASATLPGGLTAHDRPTDSTPVSRLSPADGTTSSGFDWGDAAAGLGVGLAASLGLAGLVAGVHRRRGTFAGA